MLRHAAVLFLLILITACSDGNNVPQPRPIGSIDGRIAAGIFSAGQVSIYAYQGGTRGEKLGGAELSSDGHYSVTLRATSQTVLVEIANGRYTEDASGIDTVVADGQRLTALAWYESGTVSTCAVTPLTHLATGLAAYKITQGIALRDAAVAAQQEISSAFNFDIVGTSPLLIGETTSSAGLLTDSASYGLYLAAISNLTQWISAQNGTQPHQIFNSIGFSQVLFEDVRADGKLDGIGWNQDATALMNLAYGTVALDASLYRMAIAQHLLAMTLHPRNQTGLVFKDLLLKAQTFANSRHALFGGTEMIPPLVTAPVIVPASVTPQTTVQRGTLNFEATINAIIPADTVTFTLDDLALGNALDPKHPGMLINTTQYAEGAHALQVRATDALGNHSTREFALYFDNFFVTLTSPLITNKTSYTVNGKYGLNGGVLTSLLAQGQSVIIDTDNTWHTVLTLTPGHNPVVLRLDSLGHAEQYDFTLDLDVTPPSFDTRAGHSAVRFSSSGGNSTDGKLSDTNDLQALFTPTDRTELKGIPIRRADLDGNSVPYFALKVSDPLMNGVASTAAQITVKMSYERNGLVLAPPRELKQVDTEFLIPLASETLHPDWLKSNPNDKQLIRVEAQDAAGNTQQLVLTFRVDFVVTNFALPVLTDVGADLFAATPFSQRADLNNRQFASTEYSFTNTTGKSFNIFLSDKVQHQAQNMIESMVREHRVQTKTNTEWRVGQILNALILNECPKNSGWQNVTSILNYNGTNWDAKTPPAPSLGTEFPVLSDNLPSPPAPSGWTDVLDFDNKLIPHVENLPPYLLTFDSDYIVDLNQFSRPASVKNWKLVNANNASPTTCPDVSFFQGRSAYTNLSVSGYPKNLKTLPVEQMNFSTTGFAVFDNDAGAAVVAVGGWYTIPAGHRITVKKLVTTPALTLHNDIDVADPATFTSYAPHYYDKTLTWTVERGALMSLAHDAGAANVLSMSARDTTLRAGKFVYTLQR